MFDKQQKQILGGCATVMACLFCLEKFNIGNKYNPLVYTKNKINEYKNRKNSENSEVVKTDEVIKTDEVVKDGEVEEMFDNTSIRRS